MSVGLCTHLTSDDNNNDDSRSRLSRDDNNDDSKPCLSRDDNNDDSKPCLSRDDNNDDSKHLMSFSLQLVRHSQWKSVREFICGSIVEFPLYLIVSKELGVNINALDIDRMLYDRSCYALCRWATLPETFTGDVLRIYTDKVHIGYARLIREKNSTEVTLSDFYPITDDVTIHGPAVLKDYTEYLSSAKYDLSDAAGDSVKSENIKISSVDSVLAVHSPFWPAEANEWATRRHNRGAPSKSLVKRIVSYGCDFVQVSHNRRRNDGEWRFSFSRAELFIVKSWTLSQRIVYDTLWVLNKRIASSHVCTYHFKTLMFWACDEKPAEFWQNDSLVQTVRELLIKMMNCVKSRTCVNYFIPGNNMLDHLTDTNLSYEIDALWRTSQSDSLISQVVDTCRRNELMYGSRMYNIESPAWIKRAFIIDQRVANVYDNYSDISRTNLQPDLQNALYVELSDVYKGLRFQLKSTSCGNESEKYINILKSESHMLIAVNLHESKRRDVIMNCREEFVQSITLKFLSCDTDKTSEANNENVYDSLESVQRFVIINQKHPALTGANEFKRLLYSRSFVDHENKLANTHSTGARRQTENMSIAVFDVTNLNMSRRATLEANDVEFYKEWPGQSPTVNISWFLAKAYLANLYYTTKRDVRLTIITCVDVIDVYRQSYMNKEFAERIFPVVVTTQWTGIFDKEIQEMLGFYSLCNYVYDSSDCCRLSVYLGVCPVLFSIYLLVRIEVDEDSGFTEAFTKYTENYNEHMDVCDCDAKINTGSLILTFVLDLLARRNLK